jgi:biotin transport system substrate-specific component
MKIKFLIFSSLFAVLISIGSYIYIPIPFTPIPITLQLFFVILSGILLGPIYGFLSTFIFLILGAIGLPVFAGGGSGIGHIFGKTGGYLFGFLIASFLSGYLFKLNKKLLPISIFSGIFIVHLFGTLYLSYILKISLYRAFLIGSLPFLLVDVVKGSLVYIFTIILIKNSEFRKIFLLKN